MNTNIADTESKPERVAEEGEGRGGDEVEATGRSAEIERLAGGSWMALEAGAARLRPARHYLEPPGGGGRGSPPRGEPGGTLCHLPRLPPRLRTHRPLL